MKGSSRESDWLALIFPRGIAAKVGRGEFDLEGGKTSGELFNRLFALRCSTQKIRLSIGYLWLSIPQGSKGEQKQEKKSLCAKHCHELTDHRSEDQYLPWMTSRQ